MGAVLSVSLIFITCLILSHSKKPGAFDNYDFELLVSVLDGFSLMTYDYFRNILIFLNLPNISCSRKTVTTLKHSQM